MQSGGRDSIQARRKHYNYLNKGIDQITFEKCCVSLLAMVDAFL